jgi:hypothetical protein
LPMIKWIAVVFISYEIFKLIRFRETLSLLRSIKRRIFPVRIERWQVWLNIAYLVYAVVLLFTAPVFGFAMLLFSGLISLLNSLPKFSDKMLPVMVITDSLVSSGILVLLIMRT